MGALVSSKLASSRLPGHLGWGEALHAKGALCTLAHLQGPCLFPLPLEAVWALSLGGPLTACLLYPKLHQNWSTFPTH